MDVNDVPNDPFAALAVANYANAVDASEHAGACWDRFDDTLLLAVEQSVSLRDLSAVLPWAPSTLHGRIEDARARRAAREGVRRG